MLMANTLYSFLWARDHAECLPVGWGAAPCWLTSTDLEVNCPCGFKSQLPLSGWVIAGQLHNSSVPPLSHLWTGLAIVCP